MTVRVDNMRIVVCIKQVLDPATLRVTSRGALAIEEATRIANAADLCALEEALALKDKHKVEIVALTLGAAAADDVLRLALAMGADRAVRLHDASFMFGDAHAAGYALARAVTAIGAVDLVLAGARSLDSASGVVGAEIASTVGWPLITSGRRIALAGRRASAVQTFEDSSQRTTTGLPAVITVAADSNQPRLPTVADIMTAYRQAPSPLLFAGETGQARLQVLSAEDIVADRERSGAAGARTVQRRTFPEDAAAKGDVLSGTPAESAALLTQRLRRRGYV